jgi:tRNA threonylcarbamoyladenosine biosynthesis protein TsaB
MMSSAAGPGSAATPASALLALDTSTERMSIALGIGASEWICEGAGGALASAALLPAVLELFARADTTIHALDAIAFGRGPGAFTGVRTACSAAQGLALGAGKAVLALDSLLAVAEDARTELGSRDVWAAIDARMDEIYAAHYVHADAGWQVLSAPALYTIDMLNARWREQPPLAVAGSAVAVFGERLQCGTALVAPRAWPSANALLTLARAAWAAGLAVDVEQALPLYLRDKVALTSVERDALKAAKAGPVSAIAGGRP